MSIISSSTPASSPAPDLFQHDVPSLKIHNPHDPPAPPTVPPIVGNASEPEWPEKLTLRAFFELVILPELLTDGRASATIGIYKTALSHWERCHRQEHGTTGPLLFDVVADRLGRFALLDLWKDRWPRPAIRPRRSGSTGAVSGPSFGGPPRRRSQPTGSVADSARALHEPAKGPRPEDEALCVRRRVDRSLRGLRRPHDSARSLRGTRSAGAAASGDRGSANLRPATRDLFGLTTGPISFDPRRPRAMAFRSIRGIPIRRCRWSLRSAGFLT